MMNLIILPMTKNNLKFWSNAESIRNNYNVIGVDFNDSLINEDSNILITSLKEYDFLIGKNDIVLLMMDVNDFRESNYKDNVLNAIRKANERKVTVVINKSFVNVLELHHLMSDNIKVIEEFESNFIDNHCYSIKTPIVCIGGIGLEEDQFCMEIQIQNSLLKRGINFFQIGSSKYSDFFKMKNIPSFVNGGDISISEKVRLFNHFIKKIEIDYSPEIIVIGIPSKLITLSEKLESDYGSVAYMMVSSLDVDYSIINIPDGFVDVEKLPELSQLLWEKYGLYGDYYAVSKKMIDIEESKTNGRLQFIDLNDADLIYDEDDTVLSYIGNDIGDVIVEKMIEKLSYYGGIKFV